MVVVFGCGLSDLQDEIPLLPPAVCGTPTGNSPATPGRTPLSGSPLASYIPVIARWTKARTAITRKSTIEEYIHPLPACDATPSIPPVAAKKSVT